MNIAIVRGRMQAFKVVSIATFLLFFVFVAVTTSYGLTRAQSTATPIVNTTDFVTTWLTTEANESVTIPTFPGETYNYNVNWGDNQSDTNQTSDAEHEYAVPGEYEVRISGTFPRIYFDNGTGSRKIIAVNQWGNQQWTSMGAAFTALRI